MGMIQQPDTATGALNAATSGQPGNSSLNPDLGLPAPTNNTQNFVSGLRNQLNQTQGGQNAPTMVRQELAPNPLLQGGNQNDMIQALLNGVK